MRTHTRNMPVSNENSRALYDGLKACGIRLLSTVPESWVIDLVRMADRDPAMTLVHAASEAEAAGVSMGAYLSGIKSAVVMQNHGVLAAANAIVSGVQLYRIPLLMLVSYRGEFGERDPWQTEGGAITEEILRAMRIPFACLEAPDQVVPRIAAAQALAHSASKPVALLLRRDLLWNDA
jgi:sulfopyruvate decarboxylase subunit alpha